jgi:hypothetical protein
MFPRLLYCWNAKKNLYFDIRGQTVRELVKSMYGGELSVEMPREEFSEFQDCRRILIM